MNHARWRPRVHFSPRRHWINDPNGLVWHGGEYHLFFQYNPQGDQWGHMSWGHAASSDLLHWRELPVAIAEDESWSVFSGSAVVDHQHTSGLGDGRTPPLVAVYTGAGRAPPHFQNQQLAYSLDRGRTFTRHAGNPVLDEGSTAFRDPKVFWHAPTARWVMLVSWADARKLAFYASPDLKRWQPLSTWTHEALSASGVWECPDLLRLPIEGEPGRSAWLLKFDVFEGHPAGGSGALVVVGDFDGTRFTASQPPRWVDGGRDFYAAIAFGAMPPGDARTVWLGWMSEHHYARATPTEGWRGAMTLPRELSLARGADGLLRLAQRPIAGLAALRGGEPQRIGPRSLPAGRTTLVAPGVLPVAQWIELDITAAPATAWTLGLRTGDGEATRLTVDRARGELVLDRSASGVDLKLGGWAEPMRLPWSGAREATVRLQIVVDACSVEVFSADGLAAMTALVFPQAASTGLWLEASGPVTLTRFAAWPLGEAMQGHRPNDPPRE